jgi:hypothetical protein
MWRHTLIRYLLVSAGTNLAWEIAQLPLYTIWQTGTWAELSFAVLHCTGGDILIALAAVMLALVLAGSDEWPAARYLRVAAVATAIGLGYTVYSEWLNTGIRQSWAYAPAMPRLPWLGTGLSPVLQWLILPPLGFWWAQRPYTHEKSGDPAS